jgi:hypothetical protein
MYATCSATQRLIAAFGFLMAIAPCVAYAQQGGPYDLRWNTFDGGGTTTASGGVYQLGGTIGQPDAGTVSGGTFTLRGGFWESGLFIAGLDPEDPDIPPDVPDETTGGPALVFHLYPAMPNPMRPPAEIRFDLPEARFVRLTVYSMEGARIRALAEEEFSAGRHAIRWDGLDGAGRRVGSGGYIVRIEAGGSIEQEKIVLLK